MNTPPPKKTVYLHVGSPKTGTSALQYFLLQNCERLKQKGFCYPAHDVDPNGVSAGNAQLLVQMINEDFSQAQKWVGQILDTDLPNVILSSEYFYAQIKNAGFAKLKEMLAHANTKVIVYLRRQDSMLTSVYQQQIKRHGGTFTMGMYFRNYKNDLYAYKEVRKWAQVFGNENVFVRCYEPVQFLGGTIFSDFLHVIGLKDVSDFTIPSQRINKGYNVNALEFKRLCNYLPIEQYQFQLDKTLQKYSDSRSGRNIWSYHLLSPEKRIEILRFHQENNAFIARIFLNRPDEELFYEPWPDPKEPWKPYPGLSLNTLKEIIAYIEQDDYELFSGLKKVVLESQKSTNPDNAKVAVTLQTGFERNHRRCLDRGRFPLNYFANQIQKLRRMSVAAVAKAFHVKNKKAEVFLEKAGFCPVCSRDTRFISLHSWLRDHYQCLHCRSLPRERALHTALDVSFPGWPKTSVHESSPANRHIADKAANYSASQFFPDKSLGEQCGAFRNENIEQLTFSDNAFDLFITLDVLEHVFFPDKALQEMLRVIRPGGWCVFTAPVYKDMKKTRQRATLSVDGTIEYLIEPAYHGNPVGDGRSLVTWDYGEDFLDIVKEWVGRPVIRINQVDEYHGIEGEFLDVFLIRK